MKCPTFILQTICLFLPLRYIHFCPIFYYKMVQIGGDLRGDDALYFLRILQFILGLVTLGVSGSNVSDWISEGCRSPSTLNYNTAVVSTRLEINQSRF